MILAAAIGAVGVCGMVLTRGLRAERRRRLLARQLRESLQNIVPALRSGSGLMRALDHAAREGSPPLAEEWRRTLQEIRLGQTVPEAMANLAARVSIREMAWFVTVVQVAQTTGGSLGEILDQLAVTLQEQEILREKVAALTAQGKASGALLSLLPFLMMGAMNLVAPDLAQPLFGTETGRTVIAAVIVSIAVGGLLIRKIVTIPVD